MFIVVIEVPGVEPWPRSGSRICRRPSAIFVAVRDSTFTVDDGEFFCLLGPSGCGKTTTLAHDRRAGTADLRPHLSRRRGRRRSSAHRERDIAFVFQLFALYPHMNVRQNIAFPLLCQGVPARRDQTRASRRRRSILRIDHLLDRPVSGLVRRRPPARGARPRDRAPADGLPDGRAARRARRRVPRSHVRRAARSCMTASTRPRSMSPTTSSRRCRWPTRSR